MMTYAVEEKILFPCDGFGGLWCAETKALFDDTCSDLDWYEAEALRYYTNIVAAFSKSVLAAIGKFEDTPIEIVAPSPRPDLAEELRADRRTLPTLGGIL